MAKGAPRPSNFCILSLTAAMHRTPGRQTISSSERNIARENAVVVACLEAGDIVRMDRHESQLRRSPRTPTLRHKRLATAFRDKAIPAPLLHS